MNKYLKRFLIILLYAVLSAVILIGSALILKDGVWYNALGILLFVLGEVGFYIRGVNSILLPSMCVGLETLNEVNNLLSEGKDEAEIEVNVFTTYLFLYKFLHKELINGYYVASIETLDGEGTAKIKFIKNII